MNDTTLLIRDAINDAPTYHAIQFIHEQRRIAEAVIETADTHLTSDLSRVLAGADAWLMQVFAAAVHKYMCQPVSDIIVAHGVEAAIGYLTMHRNGTFGQTPPMEMISKVWKREALTTLIDGLQQIITPAPEVANEQSDETADSAGA